MTYEPIFIYTFHNLAGMLLIHSNTKMGVGFACLAHSVRTPCPPFPGSWPRSHASLSQCSLRLTLPDFHTPHDRISGAISQRSQGAWQERNNPYLSPRSPTAPESTAPSSWCPLSLSRDKCRQQRTFLHRLLLPCLRRTD